MPTTVVTDADYQGAGSTRIQRHCAIQSSCPLWATRPGPVHRVVDTDPYFRCSRSKNGESRRRRVGHRTLVLGRFWKHPFHHSSRLDDANRAPMARWPAGCRRRSANTLRDWTIAFWHHPPYSTDLTFGAPNRTHPEMRENFWPKNSGRRWEVDLPSAGHSHAYSVSPILLDSHSDFVQTPQRHDIITAAAAVCLLLRKSRPVSEPTRPAVCPCGFLGQTSGAR